MNPPWGGKYTININTEMNYWPAEPCNLAECVEPLVMLVGELAETGARPPKICMARAVGLHTTIPTFGIFRRQLMAPTGMWPTGGAWLCLHLWDHYAFDRDKAYLQKFIRS